MPPPDGREPPGYGGANSDIGGMDFIGRILSFNYGTFLFTWLNGERVGTDVFGNRYYRSRRKRRYGREQRWVLYKGSNEASKVPPEWHAWLHQMVEEPLTESAAQPRPWQKEHLPNLTGTDLAYRPSGHDRMGGKRAPATGDYEPWVAE